MSSGGTVCPVSSALPPTARVTLPPSVGVAVYPIGISAFKFSWAGGRRGPGGIRGRITRFSPASRRRLRSLLLSRFDSSLVARRRVGWVTLTARTGSAAELKNVFRTIIKRLRRRYRFFVVWRLEYQSRGVPHFHVLVVADSPSFVFSVSRDLIRFWVELTDSSFLGQNFRWVRSISGLSLYISDMGKVSQSNPGDDSPGRWWGAISSGFSLPVIYPLVLYGLSFYVQCLRFFRSLRSARRRRFRRKKWRGRGLLSEFFDVGDGFIRYLVSLS